MSKTVNQILLEEAIRHAIYLERLKTSEVRKLISFFNKEIAPDLLVQIEKKLGSGTFSEKRLKELFASLKIMSVKGTKQMQDDFAAKLKQIGITESQWNQAVLKASIPRVLDIDFTTPHFGILKAQVSNNLVYGKTIKQWFDGIGTATAARIQQQINIGVTQGESYYHIVRRIRGTQEFGFSDGILEASRHDIESVVRTSVATAAQTAREETFKANTDVIDGVQLVATLDGRTTEICMGYDGKVFPVGEGPRPPFHFGCRTQAVPVLKSWKQLGIKLKEAPESTRSSMDGQVPAKLTYGQWLKKQNGSFQDEVLGPTRANLFREGKISIDRFTQDGKLLTLEQLRKKEGLSVDDVTLVRKTAG